jgi:hypothetical protein
MSKLYEHTKIDEYRAFVHAAELADEAVNACDHKDAE